LPDRGGDAPDLAVGTGRCAEIATGAVLPKGANAVVMVEYTRVEGPWSTCSGRPLRVKTVSCPVPT